MTLLQNEVEAIHKAKKATNAIRDDAAYAEVESAIDDLIKVIGRVQARLIESNRRNKRLERGGDEAIDHLDHSGRVRIWNAAKEIGQ